MQKKGYYLFVAAFAILVFTSCKKKKEDLHPSVDFSYTGNTSIFPATMTFTCNLNSPYTITWDFGDGSSATGNPITHTYAHMGFYTVYANAKSDDGYGSAVNYVNLSPYKRLAITNIQGSAPLLTPQGTTWDPEPGSTNPDLLFKIFNSSGTELSGVGGYVITANSFTGSDYYNPTLIISDFASSFTASINDHDLGSIPADQDIGNFSFRPADYFKTSLPFPTTFVKSNPATGASITISVGWLN